MKAVAIESSAVQNTIDSFDFAGVTVVPPLKIIAGHQATKYYTLRFGGGLPSRVLPIPKPPTGLQPSTSISKSCWTRTEKRKSPVSRPWMLSRQMPPNSGNIWIDHANNSLAPNRCESSAGTTYHQGHSNSFNQRFTMAYKTSMKTRATRTDISASSAPSGKQETCLSRETRLLVLCTATTVPASATNSRTTTR